MRTLKRNEKTFYFKRYNGRVPVLVDGYENGEYAISYDDVESARGNISASRGYAQIELFGNFDGYDKVIVMDYDANITENTVLMIDVPVNSGKYDYIVRRVSKSLNVVSIAISKVQTND